MAATVSGFCRFSIPVTVLAAAMQTSSGGDIASTFLGKLDLGRPELAAVKEEAEAGRNAAALNAFRDYFVEKCSQLPMENCRYWAFNPTSGQELLEQQTLRFARFTGGEEIVKIGAPGQVNWFPLTPNTPYFASDFPRLYWANKLVRSYVQTRDPRYLSAFIGYFADHALNHRSQYEAVMRSKWQGKYERPDWTWSTALFHCDRLHAFRSGMIAACHTSGTLSFDKEPEVPIVNASLTTIKQAIDAEKLAVTLQGFADNTLNPVVEDKIRFPDAPNQQVDLACCMLTYAKLLNEFKDAQRWEAFGGEKLRWYYDNGSVMADGSDMEQNFGYNWAGVAPIGHLLPYYPDATAQPDWFQICYDRALYRLRMLATLVKPTGPLPSMDTYSAPDNSDGFRAYFIKANAVFNDSVSERIINHQWGDASLPLPAFTSITFPYGGYNVLRSGWDKQAQFLFFKTSRPGAGHCSEDHLNIQLTAFGRELLVDSGAGYYAASPFNAYFAESFSSNTISVDGLSQNGSACKMEKQGAYRTVMQNRWYNSPNFTLSEGEFTCGYGRENPEKWGSAVKIKDVTHQRQLIFVKPAGLWIVVDRLRASQPHLYTQTWNFPPHFTEKEVVCDPIKRTIATCAPDSPNVALYSFGRQNLNWKSWYGQQTPEIRGWANSPATKETKAVDIHINWQGNGDQLLVTVIEPRPGQDSAIQSLEPREPCGFQAQLQNGSQITFLAASTPTQLTAGDISAQAERLLVLRNSHGETRGMTLDCSKFDESDPETNDFEFEMARSLWWPFGSPSPRKTAITIPAGFKWVETSDGLAPEYK